MSNIIFQVRKCTGCEESHLTNTFLKKYSTHVSVLNFQSLVVF